MFLKWGRKCIWNEKKDSFKNGGNFCRLGYSFHHDPNPGRQRGENFGQKTGKILVQNWGKMCMDIASRVVDRSTELPWQLYQNCEDKRRKQLVSGSVGVAGRSMGSHGHVTTACPRQCSKSNLQILFSACRIRLGDPSQNQGYTMQRFCYIAIFFIYNQFLC